MKKSALFFAALWLLLNPSFAGVYIEYKLSGSGQTGARGTMKMWAQNGNSRFEMAFQVKNTPETKEMEAMGISTDMDMAQISLNDQPDKSYVLDTKNKTYSILDTKGEDKEQLSASDYTISVVGNETVNGFASTHLLVKKKGEKEPVHLWIGKDLKLFPEMKRLQARAAVKKDGLSKALEAKGYSQMFVRYKEKTEDGDYQMDLVKWEEAEVPKSRFSLDGYTLKQGPLGLPSTGTGTEISPEELTQLEEAFNALPAETRSTMLEQFKKMPAATRKMMLDNLRKNQD